MRLFSAKAFCRLSGVPSRTLRRWKKSGKIQPVHRNFYSENQIMQWRIVIPLFDDLISSNVNFFNFSASDKTEIPDAANEKIIPADAENHAKEKTSMHQDSNTIFPTSNEGEEINSVDVNCRKKGGHENELYESNQMENKKITVDNCKVDKKERFNLSNTRQIVRATDMVTKKIFGLSVGEFTEKADGAMDHVFTLTEKFSKTKRIEVKFWISVLEGYGEPLPLDEFDKCVLIACMSAQYCGEPAITADQIYRILTGKTDGQTHATAEMRKKIYDSAARMMCLKTRIDFSGLEKLKTKGVSEFVLTSPVLPCSIIEATVNGQDTTVIKFLDKSPILKAAETRGQLISYSAKLLDVSKMHNSADAIKMKNYVLSEIEQMKAGRRDNLHIRFDSIFETCGIKSETRKQRFDARQTVLKFLDNLKEYGEINGYELMECDDFADPRIKKDGQKIHAAKIDVEVKEKPSKKHTKIVTKKR